MAIELNEQNQTENQTEASGEECTAGEERLESVEVDTNHHAININKPAKENLKLQRDKKSLQAY